MYEVAIAGDNFGALIEENEVSWPPLYESAWEAFFIFFMSSHLCVFSSPFFKADPFLYRWSHDGGSCFCYINNIPFVRKIAFIESIYMNS